MKVNRDRVLWITTTAALLALLVALQWITSFTAAFAGQYITGSCVNAVLAVAALIAGPWSAVTVAALSPFCAFLVGVGPKLIQLLPVIALGNIVYVALLGAVGGRGRAPLARRAAGLLCAAAAKFLTLYLLVVQVVLRLLTLPEAQVKTFTAMFSWPQLVTALLGGALALLIAPAIQRALHPKRG